MDYDKMQQRADEMYVNFQTKHKIDADDLDEYTNLIEEMTVIRTGLKD